MHEQERSSSEVEQNAVKRTEWDDLAEEVPFNAEKQIESELTEQEDALETPVVVEAPFPVETSHEEPSAAPDSKEAEQLELRKFGSLELTEEELGADQVRVSGMEFRRENDKFGRNRDRKKMCKILNKVVNWNDGRDMSRYYKKITPTMVGELVRLFDDSQGFDPFAHEFDKIAGRGIETVFENIFEALPLEAQEKIAETSYGRSYIKRAMEDKNLYIAYGNEKEGKKASGRLKAKMLAGLASSMEKQSLTAHDHLVTQDWLIRDGLAKKDASPHFEGLRDGLVEDFAQKAVESNDPNSMYFMANMAPTPKRDEMIGKYVNGAQNLNSMELACALMTGYSGELPSDKSDLSEIAALVKKDWYFAACNRARRRALEAIDGQSAGSIASYLKLGAEKGLLDEKESNGHRLSLSLFECSIHMQNQDGAVELFNDIAERYDELDDRQREIVKDFCSTGLSERETYITNYSNLTPETVPDLNEKCKEMLAAAEGGDHEAVAAARKAFCERALGASAGEITMDLLAFGVMEIPRKFRKGGKLFGMTPDEYEWRKDWRPEKINVDALRDLRESGAITSEEEALVLAIGGMMCEGLSGVKDNLHLLDRDDKDSQVVKQFVPTLEKIREYLQERAAAQYTEYMKEGLKGLVNTGETVRYEAIHPSDPNERFSNIETPVLKMEGDEFFLLAHKLGAFSSKESDRPEQWDDPSMAKYSPATGERLGYISTTAINQDSLNLARGYDSETDVVYCFTEIPPKGFCYSAEYDLYTDQSMDMGEIVAGTQDFYFDHPKKIIDRMLEYKSKDGDGTFNEVSLDRYAGDPSKHDGRMCPNYMIVYGESTSDINERTKAHAAYFGVPIILISPRKYGKKGRRK